MRQPSARHNLIGDHDGKAKPNRSKDVLRMDDAWMRTRSLRWLWLKRDLRSEAGSTSDIGTY